MSLELKFVMQNTLRFKAGKKEQASRQIMQFLSMITDEVVGYRGYMIMNSTANADSIVVMTFWETKAAMDRFYNTKNAVLNEFADSIAPLIEDMVQVQSYQTEIADIWMRATMLA